MSASWRQKANDREALCCIWLSPTSAALDTKAHQKKKVRLRSEEERNRSCPTLCWFPIHYHRISLTLRGLALVSQDLRACRRWPWVPAKSNSSRAGKYVQSMHIFFGYVWRNPGEKMGGGILFGWPNSMSGPFLEPARCRWATTKIVVPEELLYLRLHVPIRCYTILPIF